MTQVSLDAQLRCAQRELAVRRAVYPGLVARYRMTHEQAAHELAAMRAIVQTLTRLVAAAGGDPRPVLRGTEERRGTRDV
jgi:hypothetical protein